MTQALEPDKQIIIQVMPSFFTFEGVEWKGVETDGLNGGAFRFRLVLVERTIIMFRFITSGERILFGHCMCSLICYEEEMLKMPIPHDGLKNGYILSLMLQPDNKTILVNGLKNTEASSRKPTHILERGPGEAPADSIKIMEVKSKDKMLSCWLRPL